MMNRLSRIALALLVAVACGDAALRAAVTDFARNSGQSVANTTALPSVNVSPSGGSNCLAVVTARWGNDATVSGSITFDGNNMTQLARQTNGSNFSTEFWVYAMPACNGTYAVTGTLSAINDSKCLGVTVFDDVDLDGTPYGSVTNAGGGTTPASVAPSGGAGAGGLVVGGMGGRAINGLTANDTLSWEIDDGGNGIWCGMQIIPAVTSGTLDWTLSSSNTWYASGIAINEETAGGGGTPCLRSLLGVGVCN